MKKKRNLKRKVVDKGEEEPKNEIILSQTRTSDEPLPKKVKWINKQRVLVFSARGTTFRDRHLMKDLKTLMPHSKDENKMERREELRIINELCEMKNCNKAIFFEGRKKKDVYMWISDVPNGPCAKFLVENIYTMGELKLTGNCLKGSRPLLSFDENFSKAPHYRLLRELFIQVFGVPYHHPKSQPFVDKVITFSVLDNRIWYRNYQILKEDGALAEIGPRFILNPIKIFGDSFGGDTLWTNPHYVTPNLYRRQLAKAAGDKYVSRQAQKISFAKTEPKKSYPELPEDIVFGDDPYVIAAKVLGVESSDNLPTSETRPPVSFKKRKRGGKKFKKGHKTK